MLRFDLQTIAFPVRAELTADTAAAVCGCRTAAEPPARCCENVSGPSFCASVSSVWPFIHAEPASPPADRMIGELKAQRPSDLPSTSHRSAHMLR